MNKKNTKNDKGNTRGQEIDSYSKERIYHQRRYEKYENRSQNEVKPATTIYKKNMKPKENINLLQPQKKTPYKPTKNIFKISSENTHTENNGSNKSSYSNKSQITKSQDIIKGEIKPNLNTKNNFIYESNGKEKSLSNYSNKKVGEKELKSSLALFPYNQQQEFFKSLELQTSKFFQDLTAANDSNAKKQEKNNETLINNLKQALNESIDKLIKGIKDVGSELIKELRKEKSH